MYHTWENIYSNSTNPSKNIVKIGTTTFIKIKKEINGFYLFSCNEGRQQERERKITKLSIQYTTEAYKHYQF